MKQVEKGRMANQRPPTALVVNGSYGGWLA